MGFLRGPLRAPGLVRLRVSVFAVGRPVYVACAGDRSARVALTDDSGLEGWLPVAISAVRRPPSRRLESKSPGSPGAGLASGGSDEMASAELETADIAIGKLGR